jgi:hypothetical protein
MTALTLSILIFRKYKKLKEIPKTKAIKNKHQNTTQQKHIRPQINGLYTTAHTNTNNKTRNLHKQVTSTFCI